MFSISASILALSLVAVFMFFSILKNTRKVKGPDEFFTEKTRCTLNGVSKSVKKDLRDSITALYEAATGGEFETAKKPSQGDLTKTLAAIAKHSADLRRVLRTTVS